MTRSLSTVLALVALVAALTACQAITAPSRDPRCIYVGDTLGVLKKGANGIVQECVWLRSQVKTCYDEPIPHKEVTCVVGGPMYGRQS